MTAAVGRAHLARGRRCAGVVAVLLVSIFAGGCAATSTAAGEPAPSPRPAETSARADPAPSAVRPARVGQPGRTTRVTFVPSELRLADGSQAPVRPAGTVDGELEVPEDVSMVGWWDGSAYAGEAFGRTVIAGHVDSAAEGIGFFAGLSQIHDGDVVTVSGDGHRQRYEVIGVRSVTKAALATDSRAFNQTGPHRLTLITCTGVYLRGRGGYTENLIVTAKPLGLAR